MHSNSSSLYNNVQQLLLWEKPGKDCLFVQFSMWVLSGDVSVLLNKNKQKKKTHSSYSSTTSSVSDMVEQAVVPAAGFINGEEG